ncbi:MAG: prolipoprotein diacylglyceryl transferase [Alphaproteobacteria bacterium GM202ARS2]|nr:prolipoprotein diacylglyceryl transferase [Alphaproteobacteria bacterium GM202ARS2]
MAEPSFFVWPNWDPVALSIGPLMVRWYGLAYLAGFLLGWLYAVHLVKRYALSITRASIDDVFLLWIVLGVIIGGRLGYVIFYNLPYYLDDVRRILYIWQGGMAFHGGMIGAVVAAWLFCRKYRLSFLTMLDILAMVAPIGLFFGRLANFVNGELYGRVSDVAWAVIFPHAGIVPRHPSQLYEAVGEGIVLWLFLWSLTFVGDRKQGGLLQRPGMIASAFLMGYGVVRFLVEFVREPDAHLGLFLGWVTMGQLLSAAMIIAGGLAMAMRSRPQG